MRKPIYFLFALFLFLSHPFHAYAHSSAELESLLKELDLEVENRSSAIKKKQQSIARLIGEYENTISLREKIRLNDSIYQQYIYYQYDSAAIYLKRKLSLAHSVCDSALIKNVEIEKIHLYINYGLYWDAAYSIHEAKEMGLDSVQQNTLYYQKIRLYYYMHKYLENDNARDRYLRLFNRNTHQLQKRVTDPAHLPWDIQYYIYEHNLQQDKTDRLLRNISENIEQLPFRIRFYSLLYNWKAAQATKQGNINERRCYLALGALSDLRGMVSNGQSIFLLAHEMLKAGDLIRAQKYVNVGIRNSIVARSVINKAGMFDIVAEINASYFRKQQDDEQQLISFITLIGVLSLILLLTIVVLIKEVNKKKQAQAELMHNHSSQLALNKKLNELNRTLSHNNRIKEEYIGVFLGMRPYYLEKMERYRKEVIRFLKAGKIAELNDFCKAAREEKDENELLYKEFDRMFLNIIPSFIDEFNMLLREEARICPKPGELTIELRIFALIRLGIKDSAQIARYLRYSVNTIYSYRSRVKNGSLGNRDEFERAVMQIGVEE